MPLVAPVITATLPSSRPMSSSSFLSNIVFRYIPGPPEQRKPMPAACPDAGPGCRLCGRVPRIFSYTPPFQDPLIA
jgi:hypothetical protein